MYTNVVRQKAGQSSVVIIAFSVVIVFLFVFQQIKLNPKYIDHGRKCTQYIMFDILLGGSG